MSNKAYSTNNEEFNYTDAYGALDALASEGRLQEGAVYYEADIEMINLAKFMDADTILESAENQLYEEVGEMAEDAYGVPVQAVEELDALIDAWCKKHLHAKFWKCVGKSREIKVTAEDVAEHAI